VIGVSDMAIVTDAACPNPNEFFMTRHALHPRPIVKQHAIDRVAFRWGLARGTLHATARMNPLERMWCDVVVDGCTAHSAVKLVDRGDGGRVMRSADRVCVIMHRET
jgi:hypothetical protein